MIDNVEFHFEGGPNGVLLIHGLTGTPAEMRLLGKGLNRAGFTVHGMQLAGHCGNEDDLLATDWNDWYDSVRQAAEAMSRRCDNVFVAGLSMGALLALLLAAEQGERIRGVGVLGVTFRYDGWSIPWLGRLSFMLPLAKKLGIGRGMSFMERPPYGLRDERIRATVSAAMLGGNSAAAGLPGNPWHSLADMYTLAARTRRLLPQVVSPCLIAHATEDDVASLRSNAELVARKVAGPVEMLRLEDSYHMITIDRERRLLHARLSEFFLRQVPGETAALASAA